MLLNTIHSSLAMDLIEVTLAMEIMGLTMMIVFLGKSTSENLRTRKTVMSDTQSYWEGRTKRRMVQRKIDNPKMKSLF